MFLFFFQNHEKFYKLSHEIPMKIDFFWKMVWVPKPHDHSFGKKFSKNAKNCTLWGVSKPHRVIGPPFYNISAPHIPKYLIFLNLINKLPKRAKAFLYRRHTSIFRYLQRLEDVVLVLNFGPFLGVIESLQEIVMISLLSFQQKPINISIECTNFRMIKMIFWFAKLIFYKDTYTCLWNHDLKQMH